MELWAGDFPFAAFVMVGLLLSSDRHIKALSKPTPTLIEKRRKRLALYHQLDSKPALLFFIEASFALPLVKWEWSGILQGAWRYPSLVSILSHPFAGGLCHDRGSLFGPTLRPARIHKFRVWLATR